MEEDKICVGSGKIPGYSYYKEVKEYHLRNGILHRDEADLPAVIQSNGTQEWWVNGERYRRDDRPSIVDNDGDQWWYTGRKLSRETRDKNGDLLPANVDADGRKEWWRDGIRYRDQDLPNVIGSDGTQEWRVEDYLHRDTLDTAGETLPALIRADGSREWWRNGIFERECFMYFPPNSHV